MSDALVASVVIPTRNRRESLLRLLRSMAKQTLENGRFEVVVAIDGSFDGTREALVPFVASHGLRVVDSAGRGRAAACNVGARAARGRLLVFLDDDMEPAEDFLAAHVREHAPGSRLGVVGAVPVELDDSTPPVAAFIGEKFNRHLDRLAKPGYRMTFRDFYSGNFSIPRDLFLEVAGFDEEFRVYGNEDGELALRLQQAGVEIRYSARAIARQHYEKDFAALARDNIAKGRTAVLLSRKWPAAQSELRFARRGRESPRQRAVLSALLRATDVVPFLPRIAIAVMKRVERRRPPKLDQYYRFALDYFYLLGARRELAGTTGATRRVTPSREATVPRTVIHYTDSTGFGGAEVSLLMLLEGLDRRLWSPVLFHHGGAGIRLLLEEADRLNVRTRLVERVAGLFDLFRLIREVRSEGAAVFHAHLPWALRCGPGLLAATLARVPAVVATQQLFRGIGSTRQIIRNRLIAAGVDRYIAVSSEMADMLRKKALLPRRKIVVIRNAVDLRRFREEPAGSGGSTLERFPGRPIVLTVARLDPQKGLGDLLAAAAQVPDANFVIAGEGPDRERLEGTARSLGLDDRVRFLGHREDVPDLLKSCDVFVLPSLYEGFPLSVVEAMASGRPVIATAVGGTPEAVSDGENGLLIPPGDPSALAAAIRSVLSDPVLARRLGSAGRERAFRKFSAAEMVRQVVRLYEDILKAAAPVAAAGI